MVSKPCFVLDGFESCGTLHGLIPLLFGIPCRPAEALLAELFELAPFDVRFQGLRPEAVADARRLVHVESPALALGCVFVAVGLDLAASILYGHVSPNVRLAALLVLGQEKTLCVVTTPACPFRSILHRVAYPIPRGSKYPIFKDSGCKNHTTNGFRDQSP